MPCLVKFLPVFHRLFLRLLRLLLFLLLLLHVLFHRLCLRPALCGIRVGAGNGRDGNCVTEKHKQDTSCSFLHTLSLRAGFFGISRRELLVMKIPSRRLGTVRPVSCTFLTVISAGTHRIPSAAACWHRVAQGEVGPIGSPLRSAQACERACVPGITSRYFNMWQRWSKQMLCKPFARQK